MKDKISIITNFHNSEKYILECIHSVNSQLPQILTDNLDVEYILVDDQSTDNTLEIINTYFDKFRDPKLDVRIITTPENYGCGKARKFGINHSSGNYLMFLDSDDYYLNNDFVSKAYNCITETNADIVEYGFKTRNILTQAPETRVANGSYIIENNPLGNMKALFVENLMYFNVWSKIVKRSLIDCHEYSESRTFDDIETTPFWIYNAKKIVIKNSVEINYRHTDNSIFRGDNETVRYESIKALASLFEYFKDNVNILKLIYERCTIDLSTLLNYDADSEYFRKMSKLNTYMLSYIYPDTYKDITYDVENDNNK